VISDQWAERQAAERAAFLTRIESFRIQVEKYLYFDCGQGSVQ